MANSVARAKFLRIAPRKLRLVADLIRGKKVSEARDILRFTVKKGSPLLHKVLQAAVANAEYEASKTRQRINTDDMKVTMIQVNEGVTMKRMHSAPRGRAVHIRKRTSHVDLMIGD